MATKKELGQFMSVRWEYILKNMYIPDEEDTIIEPFCGQGHLLNFINPDKNLTIECYDIDPQTENTIEQDTLDSPPSYQNKFVLTNCPFLARNKSTNKKLFNKYNCDDLYKCFIHTIIKDRPNGGIIIIPLNFLSSIRPADIKLRQYFVNAFDLLQINIFEERVFDDTSYTICSIQFKKREDTPDIYIDIYPSKIQFKTKLIEENNYMIGGSIYKLPISYKYNITRLTKLTKNNPHTNILVKCIDDNFNNQIGLSMVDIDGIYIDETPKLSARTYATLQVNPHISIDKQKILVEKFNEYLSIERKKYNSLFLCNYRESKDIARKRISFRLVYSICEYLLDQIDLEDQ